MQTSVFYIEIPFVSWLKINKRLLKFVAFFDIQKSKLCFLTGSGYLVIRTIIGEAFRRSIKRPAQAIPEGKTHFLLTYGEYIIIRSFLPVMPKPK